MSDVISLLNQPATGLLITSMISLIAIFIALKPQSPTQIVWGVISSVQVVATNTKSLTDTSKEKLVVTFNEVPIKNLYAHVLRIRNAGDTAITHDYFENFQIILDFKGELHKAKIENFSNEFRFGLDWDKARVTIKVLDGSKLRADDSFILKVVSTQPIEIEDDVTWSSKFGYDKRKDKKIRQDEIDGKNSPAPVQTIGYGFIWTLFLFTIVLFIASFFQKINSMLLFSAFILLTIIFLSVIVNYFRNPGYKYLNNRARKKRKPKTV